MTEHERHLDLTAAEIERITGESFAELLRRIRAGEDPRAAIEAIQKLWRAEYVNTLRQALQETLGAAIGRADMLAYTVGQVTLSGSLYAHSRQTSAAALLLVREHLAGWHAARALAFDLYEGYRFRPHGDLLSPKVPLPKYLRDLFGGDQTFIRAWNKHAGAALLKLAGDSSQFQIGPKLASAYARARAAVIRTAAMKAAYMQTITALEQGAGIKRLAKLLEVAWYERNRYYGNRIAQTELHRAWSNRQAAEIMADDTIEVVRIKMSATHPERDVCDLIASVNRYGLGPGLYPKALAPKPGFHPFCRCAALSVRTKSAAGATEAQGAERAWLRRLPKDEAARVLGSRAKLQRVLNGEPWQDVFYAGAPEGYGFETLANAREMLP